MYLFYLFIIAFFLTNRLSGCPAWLCRYVSPLVRSVRIFQSVYAQLYGWTWCCHNLSCECWWFVQSADPPSTNWPLALVYPKKTSFILWPSEEEFLRGFVIMIGWLTTNGTTMLTTSPTFRMYVCFKCRGMRILGGSAKQTREQNQIKHLYNHK